MLIGPKLRAHPEPSEICSNDIGAAQGEIDASVDAERRIIFVTCTGKWSPGQIDAIFAQMKGLVRDMRTRFGRVRVLVDRRLSISQSDATVQRLKMYTEREYRDCDRIAVVVDTSLSKLQLRSQIDLSTHKLFISESAAYLWLSAHD